MQNNAGPQQTDVWPLIWNDLDPNRLPAWVVWQRTCQFKADDGCPCPRRMAGAHFSIAYCDHHRPDGASNSAGQAIG